MKWLIGTLWYWILARQFSVALLLQARNNIVFSGVTTGMVISAVSQCEQAGHRNPRKDVCC